MTHLGPLGDPPLSIYLKTIHAALDGRIAPAVQGSDLQPVLGMISSLLLYLIAAQEMPAGNAICSDAEAALQRLIGEAGTTSDAPVIEIALRQTQAALASDSAVLDGLAGAEQAHEAVGHPPTRTDRRAVAVALQDYLPRRAGGDVRVEAVGAPLGGYSKDVFVVSLAGAQRPAERIVIRRDVAGGPVESEVVAEAAVLRAMRAHGVPVAAVLWAEPDPAILGDPFLVMEYVRGAPALDYRANFGAGSCADTMRRFADVLGRIHSVSPEAAGLAGSSGEQPVSARIAAMLDGFEEQWRRRRRQPNLAIAAALAWMRRFIPADDGLRPVIVHGDATLRNALLEDGRICALLDWETWHLGDPAEDLAYCRDEVETVLAWEEFLACYRAAGGPAVSPVRIAYWSFWKFLRGAITSISMLDSLTGTDAAELRVAFGAMHFTRLCLGHVIRMLPGYIEGQRAESGAQP